MKCAIGLFMDRLKVDDGYNFLSENETDLSRGELVDIAKELLYAIHTLKRSDPVTSKWLLYSAAEELAERYEAE